MFFLFGFVFWGFFSENRKGRVVKNDTEIQEVETHCDIFLGLCGGRGDVIQMFRFVETLPTNEWIARPF